MLIVLSVAVATIVLAYCVYNVLFHPLSKYPGPRLAAMTDGWKFFDTVSGMRRTPKIVALHQKHGDIVRLGPNHLSFAHPDAIRDIYGVDKHFPKSLFYWAAAPVAGGEVSQTLFSSNDIEWHDSLRNSIQSSFKTSAIAQYEPGVDEVIKTFRAQLRDRCVAKTDSDGTVDLPKWMHWFALDVLGQVTYGEDFGALRNASDVDGMIAVTHNLQTYTVIAGSMPVVDRLWAKNPVRVWLNRMGLFNAKPNAIVTYAMRRHEQRLFERRYKVETSRSSLLESFLLAKDRNPGKLTDAHCISLGISMIVAGSESTAITLAAVFYFLLKNPETYRRLQSEVDKVFGLETQDYIIPWRLARSLPYLDACIKETFRMHPAGRFSLERVVPSQGATIAGHLVAGGTVVGIHPWAMHRNQDVFGEDIEQFRPERWLHSQGAAGAQEAQRIARMNGALMHFGQGRFSCLGKDISLLEMYKVVPTLLRRYTFVLKDPVAQWRFEAGGFVNVSNIDVLLQPREVMS